MTCSALPRTATPPQARAGAGDLPRPLPWPYPDLAANAAARAAAIAAADRGSAGLAGRYGIVRLHVRHSGRGRGSVTPGCGEVHHRGGGAPPRGRCTTAGEVHRREELHHRGRGAPPRTPPPAVYPLFPH